jgi:hypothetical protein
VTKITEMLSVVSIVRKSNHVVTMRVIAGVRLFIGPLSPGFNPGDFFLWAMSQRLSDHPQNHAQLVI